MSKIGKPLIIIVLALAVAGGAALYMSKQTAQAPDTASSTGSVPTSAGRLRGPQNARITLVEFGDYQCPRCGYFAPIVDEMLHRYPKDVRLEFHHFPLIQIHRWAMPAALAAEAAADQGKFWEMHDMLYANQDKW